MSYFSRPFNQTIGRTPLPHHTATHQDRLPSPQTNLHNSSSKTDRRRFDTGWGRGRKPRPANNEIIPASNNTSQAFLYLTPEIYRQIGQYLTKRDAIADDQHFRAPKPEMNRALQDVSQLTGWDLLYDHQSNIDAVVDGTKKTASTDVFTKSFLNHHYKCLRPREAQDPGWTSLDTRAIPTSKKRFEVSQSGPCEAGQEAVHQREGMFTSSINLLSI